jgi:MoaA/NifB/PqqE/SkfB family radical SAM enzyme
MSYNFPEKIELEITTKCTLFCHACARTLDPDEIVSKWKHGQLSLESIDRALSTPGLSKVVLSGAFGDPIYHTEFPQVIKLIKSKNLRFHLDTNGSYRSKEWWQEVAESCTRGDTITFSVDGMPGKDLYRENSDWPSILTGIQTLIKYRHIHVVWKWIVWKYNQNDILEGYKLSRELGIKEFLVVQSGRAGLNKPEFQPTRDYDEIITELQNYRKSINETRS